MKAKSIGFFPVMLLALSILVFIGFNNNGRCQEEKTITGIVTAIEWDEKEKVTAVAINVVVVENDEESEEDYRVLDNEKGKELFNYIDQEVVATGTVSMDEDGNKSILISEYSVTESEEGNDPE